MKREDRDELIRKEVRTYLLKMHKEEKTLVETLDSIVQTITGLRFAHEQHFIYMLEGISQDEMPKKGKTPEETAHFTGYNESAEEVNYAVKLAKSIVRGENQ